MQKSFEQFIKEFQAADLTKRAYEKNLALFDRFLKGKEPDERKVEEYMLDMEGRGSGFCHRKSASFGDQGLFPLAQKTRDPGETRILGILMIRGPKVHNKIPRLIASEEVKAVVAAAGTDYERALIMTIYDAALRIKELMGLLVEDINFKDMEIKITGKGGDEALIPVGQETIEALRKYIGTRQGKVFPQPYYQLAYDLKRVANKAGVRKLHPHELRHARAQNLRDAGVKVEDAQEFLRHKNITTTMRYFRGDPSQLRKKINNAF